MPQIRHRSRIRSLPVVGALLLASAAACSGLTDPGRPPSSFTVAATSAVYPPPAPTVEVTGSAIIIDGTISTPTPCYTVSASTSTAHDTLVARIVGTSKGNNPCVQGLGMWHYVLTVSPRPTGLTVVRVVHDGGIGTESVVLERGIGEL